MFLRAVRAAEPMLKELSRRVFSPWKGNHVVHGDLIATTTASSPNVIPWGFVSPEKMSESVTADRASRGGGKADDGRVEKRAEHLNLDSWEFLQGTEEAYRCAARLFAPPPSSQPPLDEEHASARAPAHGQALRSASASGANLAGAGAREQGRGLAEPCGLGAGGEGSEVPMRPNPPQAGSTASAARTGPAESAAEEQAPARTDFFDSDVTSPQMSMFLNDVLESYRVQGLVPRLSVSSVEAKLCKVGVRLGGISKNTNFLGLMGADEAKYHLTMGMMGPEGVVMNELEGRAPRRVIADVELKCEEDFVLEDAEGNVVHRLESQGPKVHYMTLQSNIGEGTSLEWQITNINDVIKPTYSYYFSRFGH
ncbi:unnamed protein product [Scytosiphon promiscuus]